MSEQNRDREESPPGRAQTGSKKPYHTPVLTVHGKIDEITLSGPGRRQEAGSGHSHP
jgi:hypothetical protein